MVLSLLFLSVFLVLSAVFAYLYFLIALMFPHFNDDLFGYTAKKGKNVSWIKVAEISRLVQGLNATKPTISGSVQRFVLLIFVHLNIDSFFAMATFVIMTKG